MSAAHSPAYIYSILGSTGIAMTRQYWLSRALEAMPDTYLELVLNFRWAEMPHLFRQHLLCYNGARRACEEQNGEQLLASKSGSHDTRRRRAMEVVCTDANRSD